MNLTPKKIPTDLEILNTIYELYHADFVLYDDDKRIRQTKVMVPIDCQKIADILKVNGDIVFGCLHFHLEKKYGYEITDGSVENARVRFFALRSGNDRNCVNFPLLVSVLAGLRKEEDKFWTSTKIAALALIFSVFSLGTDVGIWKLIQFFR